MMIPVYKAWHALKLPIRNLDFNTIAPMPIYMNKFITNGVHSIEPNAQVKPIVQHLWRVQGECVTTNTLYEEVTPTPTTQFDLDDMSTWKYVPKSPIMLNQVYGTNYSHFQWIQMRAQIPTSIVQTMIKGHSVTVGEWCGTNLEDELIDIYYVYKDKCGNTQLAYFDFSNEEANSPISLKSTSEDMYRSVVSYPNLDNWYGWEDHILPDLMPIRVSAIQGKPRPLGFTRSSFGADMFLMPRRTNSREEEVDIEKSIASSFHSNVLNNLSDTYYKPHFNPLFKKVRKLPHKLLSQLGSWPPSQEETDGGHGINWAHRMKVIMNCPFALPKYRQLVYWITTETLMDGKRLQHMPRNPSKGVCPFCNVSAESKHIFESCTKTMEFWAKVDHLGSQHWRQYTPLEYEYIPTILNTYDPISLFHLSGLWALWVTWCPFFYEERSSDEVEEYKANWVRLLMAEMKKQFIQRACEAPSMIQWIRIVEDRRTSFESQSPEHVPEKEFLLIHTHLVKTNESRIELHEHKEAWICKGFLLSIDTTTYHRPRLRIHHNVWTPHIGGAEGGNAALPIPVHRWVGILPLSVAPP